MKFKDYVKQANDLLAEHPECGELDVFAFANGDEGSDSRQVCYAAGMYMNNNGSMDTPSEGEKADAVCLN